MRLLEIQAEYSASPEQATLAATVSGLPAQAPGVSGSLSKASWMVHAFAS